MIKYHLFGAAKPDVTLWRSHPDVVSVDVGAGDWVELAVKSSTDSAHKRCKAAMVLIEEVRGKSEHEFWGEGECPVYLFERVPLASSVKVWIEGHVDGDSRTCWYVAVKLK